MECNHDCSSCSANCPSNAEYQDPHEKLNELSSIKKVIGIVSGKGGVGKSLVTGALAVELNRRGYKTAVMDADITGPSIPKAFGLEGNCKGMDNYIFPMTTKTGIDVISINLLLENKTDPVIWRGPVISGVIKQFWKDVIWKDEDYLFIDMPPGTGDAPLEIFQSIPVDGIIVVASPQELVSMIVSKALNMAKMMNIPLLGLVENYSYFKCPDCGKEHKIFGDSHIDEVAEEFNTQVLAKIPFDQDLAKCVDTGTMELFVGNYFDNAVNYIEDNLGVEK